MNQEINEWFYENRFSSGEKQVLEYLSGKLNIIFDVGCNVGAWTTMARKFNLNAEIHTFEIVPDTYRKSLKNLNLDDNIVINSFGLSDKNGLLPIKTTPYDDALATMVFDSYLPDAQLVYGITVKGDDYMLSRNIQYIDYLKIDAEGAESLVLNGFMDALTNNKIGIVQFEYGTICILTKFMLIDFHKLFIPLKFRLAKLTTNGAEFFDYNLNHEVFTSGPNYIAVHESKLHLFT